MSERHRWPPSRDEALRRLWEQGFVAKAIAPKLGVSIGAVKRRRLHLRLPPRRPWRGRNKGKNLSVYLSAPMLAAAHRRAAERFASLSAYVRSLIARDVPGLDNPTVHVIKQNDTRVIL